ncbi:hypothetical protein D3C72_1758900 [compost metagenome]
MARSVRSASWRAIAFCTASARSALSCSVSQVWARREAAVFNPEKEKSQSFLPSSALGRSKREPSPDAASFSSAGPPG